jgi:CubicO group peptidase (beta-lactamase class C family)
MAQTVEIHPDGEPRVFDAPALEPAAVAGLVIDDPVAADRWGPSTVAEVLARHQACSLVVLHHGRLVYEWHRADMDPLRRHRSFSVTKSFVGVLAAMAVQDGALDRAALVGDVLPELSDSGFGTATVEQIADMTVSVAYDEDYVLDGATPGTAGARTFVDYLLAIGSSPAGPAPDGPPSSLRALLPTFTAGAFPHGHVFSYATPVTDVLGWLVERARNASLADLLGSTVWSRIGAERPAKLMLDPAGTAVAGGGLLVATRDLARFGQWLLEQATGAMQGPVDPSVIERIRNGGSPEAYARNALYGSAGLYTYRDQWWMPTQPNRPITALGIHGQVLWVSPDAGIVIATHADGPLASDERRDLEHLAMCRAIEAASVTW